MFDVLKFEPIGRARGLVILEVDGATGGGWCQINAIACQDILVGADPDSQGIRVVCGNNGDIFWEKKKQDIVTELFHLLK